MAWSAPFTATTGSVFTAAQLPYVVQYLRTGFSWATSTRLLLRKPPRPVRYSSPPPPMPSRRGPSPRTTSQPWSQRPPPRTQTWPPPGRPSPPRRAQAPSWRSTATCSTPRTRCGCPTPSPARPPTRATTTGRSSCRPPAGSGWARRSSTPRSSIRAPTRSRPNTGCPRPGPGRSPCGG